MRELPYCLCGCGQRVKLARCKYASPACVPSSVRAENCRKGRKTYAAKKRAQRFNGLITHALEGRRVVTKETLWQLCRDVDRQSYNTGYRAALRACGKVAW